MAGCSVEPRLHSKSIYDINDSFKFPNKPDNGLPQIGYRSLSVDETNELNANHGNTSIQTKLKKNNYLHAKLDADQAVHLINLYRHEHNLKPIRLNVLLTKAAKLHSRDLANLDRVSHFGSDGSDPLDRVKRVGYTARVAAENIGTGQLTFKEVMAGWQKSTGHKRNLLLHDAEHVGVALVFDPDTEFRTFWTLVIGAPS